MNSSCLNIPGVTLKENQSRIAQYVRDKRKRGLIVFHGTGSGKTIAAIASIRCFLADNPNSHAYILAPTSVTEQFRNQVEKLGLDMDRVHVYPHVTFILRFKEDKIRHLDDAMIVVDEAHLFANVDAMKEYPLKKEPRSTSLYRACRKAKKVLLMTATPAVNIAKQMYNYLKLIEGRHFNAKRSIDDVYKDVKCYVSYYKKKEDDEDYPKKVVHIRRFDMPKKYLEQYNELEMEIKEEMSDKFRLKPFLSGLRQASNKIEGVENPKVEYLLQQVLDKPKLPTVIYSSWRASGIEYVQGKLRERNIKYNEITGSVSRRARAQASEAFNKREVPVLFITAAGAEGLDLKGTRRIFLLEPYWTQSRHDQVIGRGVRYRSHAHLPENERRVDVYYLALQKPDNGKNQDDEDEFVDFLSADDQVMLLCFLKGKKIEQLYTKLATEGDFRSQDCKK